MNVSDNKLDPARVRPPFGPEGSAVDVPAEVPGTSDRHFFLWLTVLTLAGLAWRVVFTVVARNVPPPPTSDQTWYHVAGQMLADGVGYGNPFVWGGLHRYIPSAGHPPLYPTYLGVVSFLGMRSVLAHRLATGLLGALAIPVLGLAGRELAGGRSGRTAGRRAGLVAAGVGAAYPNLWINDPMILSESMYILLTALFLWAAARFWKQPSVTRVAAVSAIVGLAALTRSEAVLFYPFAVLPLTLRAPQRAWKERFRLLSVAAIVAVVVIGPWIAYNQTRGFVHRVIIVSGSGIAMSYANCGAAYSGQLLGYWSFSCGITPAGNSTLCDPKKATFHTTCDETILDDQARRQALHYIRTHLREQPKVIAARVGRIYDLYRPHQGIQFDSFLESRGIWPSRLGVWTFYPITLLAIGGAIEIYRRRGPLSPFAAVFVTTTLAAALTFGITRYRAAFDAACVVLAGVAVDALLCRLQRRWQAPDSPPEPTEPEPVPA